jgi:hypothetical protein
LIECASVVDAVLCAVEVQSVGRDLGVRYVRRQQRRVASGAELFDRAVRREIRSSGKSGQRKNFFVDALV